jgi:hypothetical protein
MVTFEHHRRMSSSARGMPPGLEYPLLAAVQTTVSGHTRLADGHLLEEDGSHHGGHGAIAHGARRGPAGSRDAGKVNSSAASRPDKRLIGRRRPRDRLNVQLIAIRALTASVRRSLLGSFAMLYRSTGHVRRKSRTGGGGETRLLRFESPSPAKCGAPERLRRRPWSAVHLGGNTQVVRLRSF